MTWYPEDASRPGESQMSYVVADSIQQAADAVSANVHDIVSVWRMGNVHVEEAVEMTTNATQQSHC